MISGTAPVFRDSGNGATTPGGAFDALLNDRYAGWTGYQHCEPASTGTKLDCFAEMHQGATYRLIAAAVAAPPAASRILQLNDTVAWTRRWAPVPRARLRAAGASGTATANSPAFDWGWVAAHAINQSLPADVSAAAQTGAATATGIYTFHCTGAALVTCTNSTGDAMRYTRGPRDAK